ncbi:MAG: hypothetical protein JJT76_17500 [Clostridiaceae bacterium]|nr:hypothetical protein [Clostridiaceae bacterium]
MGKVANWISMNFQVKDLSIKDCPLFPQGKIITDKNNDKMLIYLNIMTEEVEYKIL